MLGARRWRGSRTVLVGWGALAVMASSAALSAASGVSGSGLPPGCAANRVAGGFHTDGSSAGGPGAPIVCANNTGFGGAETAISVGPNGDVVVEPAILAPGLLGTGVIDNAPGPRFEWAYTNTSGLALSRDGASSWQFVEPAGSRFACCDAALYTDRMTGRLFYSAIFGSAPVPLDKTAPGGESRVMSSPASPAGYTRWTSNTMYGHVSENPKFTSAPAPAAQPNPVPGENMSYWCAFLTRLPVENKVCYRSFDGGASWQFASVVSSNPVPQHSECGSNSESAGYPQGARDGSLWVLVTCGGTTYLAKSTDEAATFPILHKTGGAPYTVPGAPNDLRVDSAGNLYTLQEAGSDLLLRVSKDGGLTWGNPLDMTAPAARKATVGQWWVAVGYQPGQVAASYLASRSSGGQDGFITVTHDALDANPVFYASTINPPGAPMVTSASPGDDWITVDFGPDGTPWASFYSDCQKNQSGKYTDPSCVQDGGQWMGGTAASPAHADTVGRLLFAK